MVIYKVTTLKMIQHEITVRNKKGIHARPASLIAQTAANFASKVYLIRGDDEINAKSIIGILTLGATYNSTLTIRVDGEDEKRAMKEMTALFERKLT